MCSSVVGILAFLSQTICNKEWKGIIIHGCVLMLYFALWFKKYMTRKISNFLVHLMGATAVCLLVFDLDNYLKYDFVQMPWNYVVSSSLPGKNLDFFKNFDILFICYMDILNILMKDHMALKKINCYFQVFFKVLTIC